MLVNDIIGNPAKYIVDDSPTELHSDSTDSSTLLRQGALVWDVDNSKMYVYLDTDDRDNVDITAEDLTDIAKYEYVIGRFPNSWFNAMDSGKPMPVNFNLVGINDGVDYTSDEQSTTGITLSSKANVVFEHMLQMRKTNPTQFRTRTVVGGDFNYMSNSIHHNYGTIASHMHLFYYTAQPKPTVQSTPLRTIAVSNKMIATSSHSVYQGAMLSNAVTGKVSVADVERGFESKGLNDVMYDNAGVINTKPSYNPLSLSLSDSPASKLFTSLEVDDNGEILLAVTGEELINDLTSEGDIDGTDGTVDLISNRIYKVTVGNHIGRYIATSKAFTDIKLDDYILGSDGRFRDLNNTILDGLIEYLGSGFGDFGEFEQLTNGTTEDLNGNVVRTYHGSVRTGYYIGDE